MDVVGSDSSSSGQNTASHPSPPSPVLKLAELDSEKVLQLLSANGFFVLELPPPVSELNQAVCSLFEDFIKQPQESKGAKWSSGAEEGPGNPEFAERTRWAGGMG